MLAEADYNQISCLDYLALPNVITLNICLVLTSSTAVQQTGG